MTPAERRRLMEAIERRSKENQRLTATDRNHIDELAQDGFTLAILKKHWLGPAAPDPHERQTP